MLYACNSVADIRRYVIAMEMSFIIHTNRFQFAKQIIIDAKW